jgi:hypothetical protein
MQAQVEVPKKWRFNFQLDNRFSKIRDNEVVIFGGKIGLQYKKLTRFGLGTSFIINPVTVHYINKKTNTDAENIINFWYVSVFNDWILYKNNHIECFVTEQVGYGKPTFVKEISNDVVRETSTDLYVNELSGQVNYKILPWIGVGTGVGYRSLFNKKSVLTNTFDAPIYIFKIIIFPESFFKN